MGSTIKGVIFLTTPPDAITSGKVPVQWTALYVHCFSSDAGRQLHQLSTSLQ